MAAETDGSLKERVVESMVVAPDDEVIQTMRYPSGIGEGDVVVA
jgi:hypothetical protein